MLILVHKVSFYQFEWFKRGTCEMLIDLKEILFFKPFFNYVFFQMFTIRVDGMEQWTRQVLEWTLDHFGWLK